MSRRSGNPPSDLGPRLSAWVNRFAPSFVCWDLVALLHEPLHCARDVPREELLSVANGDEERLTAALDHLAGEGVLEIGEGAGTVRYAAPAALDGEIEEFLAVLATKSGRVLAVQRILELAEEEPSHRRRRGTAPDRQVGGGREGLQLVEGDPTAPD